MGKLLKYCSSCEEGFAERFGFCPNCGAALEAFEMNPVTSGAASDEPVFDEPQELALTEEVETAPPAEERDLNASQFISVAPMVAEEPEPFNEEPIEDLVKEHVAETIDEPAETPQPATPVFVSKAVNADEPQRPSRVVERGDDGEFHVTVIQEKNGKQRNMLLLGSLMFMVVVAIGGTVASLFQKDLGIGSISEDYPMASLVESVPAIVEEMPEPEKDTGGGGGGGGGRQDKEEVSRGDLADQSPKPVRPPDAKVPRLTNPSLELPPPTTEGNRKFPKEYDRWGDPNARFGNLSNGPGSGGGMGSGVGTGQGSGVGTGTGSGTGSGSGGGEGTGNGDGRGPGGGAPPMARPTGPSAALKIISKPRAGYTDEARTNQVQGSVRLRVTFLANGQVGSVTAVSRLPYGLTEKAIAAAKQITFEPKKVNGQAVATTATLDYVFNMY